MAVKDAPKHPMQPIGRAKDGVVRFKKNAIVSYLLDICTEKEIVDLNTLAVMNFSQEDREQFAQLIGYSVSGYGELSYVSEESRDQADATADLISTRSIRV